MIRRLATVVVLAAGVALFAMGVTVVVPVMVVCLGAALIVMALIDLGVWVVRSDAGDESGPLLCRDPHGDVPTPLHVRGGYVPPDSEAFEARIAQLRATLPDFREGPYRCMGPAKYWAAYARAKDAEARRDP